MEYHGILIGGKIYSLRVAKGMTQEQLAAELCVSPTAVSKWERNLSNPGIEMLWALADFFGCTIDELVGRSEKLLEQLGSYDRTVERMAEVAEDLLKCCELARQEGLLALEGFAKELAGTRPDKGGFLAFAIRFFLSREMLFGEELGLEWVFGLLGNYAEALPEEQRAEGRMVTELLRLIVSGENPTVLQEVIASHVGMGYFEKLGYKDRGGTREEILAKYRDKPQYSAKTGLLEVFGDIGDFEIQTILRNLDNDCFTKAMCGASGRIVVRFLANLADVLLRPVSRDIDSMECTEEGMVQAQRRVLEVGAFAVNREMG